MPFYNRGKQALLNGEIDLTNDTIKVALCTSSYSPNIDTHEDFADITNEVADGNGYTAGGQALAGKNGSVDNTNDLGLFDCTDPQWTTATFTYRYAIFYQDTGTPTTSLLIAYYDFATDQVVSNGTATLQIDTTGLFSLEDVA